MFPLFAVCHFLHGLAGWEGCNSCAALFGSVAKILLKVLQLVEAATEGQRRTEEAYIKTDVGLGHMFVYSIDIYCVYMYMYVPVCLSVPAHC